jgi:Mce-associated membrane protein
MPPGKSEPKAPGADDSGDLSSAEAAEAAAAEAEARAEAARARAIELRRKLEAARADADPDDVSPQSELAAEADSAADEGLGEPDPAVTETPIRNRRLRVPRLQTVAVALAVLLTIGLLAGTGLMVWQHRKAADERHHSAEFSAAARQGVVNLMSMDHNAAKESVQRVIDDSTGKFKANFEDSSEDLIKAMQDSKVVTKVTVNDAAVESMTKDSAVVLVAATSQRQDAQAPKEDQQPRVWRVVVSVQRDGGQIKMSDVEFV